VVVIIRERSGNSLPAVFSELSTFLAVARYRSFKQAAVERSVAASAMSHSIRSLEERVGVRLFHRTTRSVALTEAGARFPVRAATCIRSD
jgi:DNA-binding transcriptional LysR family regulator